MYVDDEFLLLLHGNDGDEEERGRQGARRSTKGGWAKRSVSSISFSFCLLPQENNQDFFLTYTTCACGTRVYPEAFAWEGAWVANRDCKI
jgi:hypothetical protein